MKLLDWMKLAQIYLVVFGLQGLLLLIDRAVRRILAPQYYRHTWPATIKTVSEGLNIQSYINSDSSDYEKLFTTEKQKIVNAADRIMKREFQIASLGWLDFGSKVNWHRDPTTRHQWSTQFYSEIDIVASFNSGTDIKMTWELSRFHQAVILARAYWLTGDTVYRKDLIDHWSDWTDNNPCPYGINWTSSMEVSIRVVNLILALWIVADKDNNINSIPSAVFNNILEHGKYIIRNLEISSKNGKIVAGNHLISNYSALTCIGLFLSDVPLARDWITIGMRGLNLEIKRQVLPDGLHYESSLHYHKFVLETLLITGILAKNSGLTLSSDYKESVSKMCDAVVLLTRPDGQLPTIGDSDGGRLAVLSGYYLNRSDNIHDILALGAVLLEREDIRCLSKNNLGELFWLIGPANFSKFVQASETFSVPVYHQYKSGGLCVLQNREHKDFILFRTDWPEGECPTGHRHNDLLSIEIWLNGDPITVDPGTQTYTADFNVRNELRSTKSHATVSLNNDEQNLIPFNSPFELISKTNSGKVRSNFTEELITVASTAFWNAIMSHDRSVSYSPNSGELVIEDTIVEADTACWNWPLFPGSYELEATFTTDLELSTKRENLKFANVYGSPSTSRVIRLSSDTKKRASVKFVFNRRKGNAKALNKDSTMVS